MKTIRISDLQESARARPSGYVDDVLGRAIRVTKTHVFLEDEEYDALKEKYRTGRTGTELKKLGLGGMIKAGLSAIGITEERVSKAIGKPCGCSKRAEKLDELGRKFGIG